jgi:hypothetical protein
MVFSPRSVERSRIGALGRHARRLATPSSTDSRGVRTNPNREGAFGGSRSLAPLSTRKAAHRLPGGLQSVRPDFWPPRPICGDERPPVSSETCRRQARSETQAGACRRERRGAVTLRDESGRRSATALNTAEPGDGGDRDAGRAGTHGSSPERSVRIGLRSGDDRLAPRGLWPSAAHDPARERFFLPLRDLLPRRPFVCRSEAGISSRATALVSVGIRRSRKRAICSSSRRIERASFAVSSSPSVSARASMAV